MRAKADDKEDRAEIRRGKPPSRAEERAEDRAGRTAANLVKKSKSGKGTITYTPGRAKK